MPDNKQIDETLQYFLDHSIIDTSKLSSEGKRLVNVLCQTSILSCPCLSLSRTCLNVTPDLSHAIMYYSAMSLADASEA
jgi:hypothetical protein